MKHQLSRDDNDDQLKLHQILKQQNLSPTLNKTIEDLKSAHMYQQPNDSYHMIGTCHDRTKFWPVIIGGEALKCKTDVILTNIDSDESSNEVLVSGYVDSSILANDCNFFTKSQSGLFHFMALLNYQGNYKWLNVLESNSSIEISAISYGFSQSFAALNFLPSTPSFSGSKFRIAKLATATGIQNQELNFDQMIETSGNGIIRVLFMQNSSESSLYASLIIKSSVFGNSVNQMLISKFDSSLSIIWSFRTQLTSSTPNYELLALKISTSHLWLLTAFYNPSAQLKFAVQKIEKATGSIVQELNFPNGSPSILQGQLQISNEASTWYTAIYYSNSNQVSLQYGDISPDLVMSGNYRLSTQIESMQLQIHQIDGDFQLFGLSNSGISSANFITYSTNLRIVLIKISQDSSNLIKSSCLQSSEQILTPPTSESISITELNTSPIYSLISASISPYLYQQSFFSLKNQSILGADTFYTLRDTVASQYCSLPLYLNQDTLGYDFNSQDGVTVQGSALQVKDCTGRSFIIDGIFNADGTTSDISLNPVTKVPSMTFSSANSLTFSGDRSYRLAVNQFGITQNMYIKVRFVPKTSYVKDPLLPSHDITSCEESIYPLMFGFDINVELLWFDLDPYGNLIRAGNGLKIPYGSQDGVVKGFVALTDQRGANYWILQINLMMDTSRASSCHYATFSAGAIYAGCSISSEDFSSSLNFVHLVKLNHQSGQVIYIKRAPQHNINPNSQIVLNFRKISTEAVAIYTGFHDQLWNVALLKYDDASYEISLLKFYNYMNMTISNFPIESIVEEGSDSFWIIRHQVNQGTAILRGSIGSGVLLRGIQLQDMTSDDCLSCQSTNDGNGKLLIPSIQISPSKAAYLYQLESQTLSVLNSVMITLPSSYSHSSASVCVDDSFNIHLILSGASIQFFKLDGSLNLVGQKAWSGYGTPNFSIKIVGSKFFECSSSLNSRCPSSTVYSGFSANLDSSPLDQLGTFIFRGYGEDNCFTFPDVESSNATWYAAVQSITSLANPIALSDFGSDYIISNDNYPLLKEVFSHSTKNYGYSNNQAERYEWGEIELPNYYKRYPWKSSLCGCVARQTKYQTMNGEGTIIEVMQSTMASQVQTIEVNSTFTNCQDRPFTSVIWNANENSQSNIPSEITTSYTFLSNTRIRLDRSRSNFFHQQNFRVRYYDMVKGTNQYFYDHSLLVSYVSNTNLTSHKIVQQIQFCTRVPFPVSIGMQVNALSYQFIPQSVVARQDDLSLYIVGSSMNNQLFMDYTVETEQQYGMIIMLSQTASVVWINSVTYLQDTATFGTSITCSSDFVYATFTKTLVDYKKRNTVLMKLTANEGKVMWTKRFEPRNLFDSFDFLLDRFYELKINPFNNSQILSSVIYYWINNTAQVAGNVMIYDNGTDISSLYDYQFRPISDLQSFCNAGAVEFDSDGIHAYLTGFLYINQTINANMLIMKIVVNSGEQVWGKVFDTLQFATVGNMQPSIVINELTSLIYVAGPQQPFGIEFEVLKKDSTEVIRRVIKFSTTTTYSNFDLAADHQTGNLIVVAVFSATSSEIYFLNKDLGYLKGYQLHQSFGANPGRMIATTKNFFYLVYKGRRFSNNFSGSIATVQKKSYSLFETQRHECHLYTESSGYYEVQNRLTSGIQIPKEAMFFSNESLAFQSDFYIRSRMLNRYFVRLRPGLDLNDGTSIQGDGTSCSFHTLNDPTINLQYPWEIVMRQGEVSTTYVYDTPEKRLNCQGDPMTFNEILDEDIRINYRPYSTQIQSSTAPYFQINANSVPPQPGVRFYLISLSRNGVTGFVVVIATIFPLTTNNATIEQPEELCPENDEQYPKIIGSDTFKVTGDDTILGGADIEQQNGNTIMCGRTKTDPLMNVEWDNGYENSWIVMFDRNGILNWGLTSTHLLGTDKGTIYFDCRFGGGFLGVFALLFITNHHEIPLHIVRHDYDTGRVRYARTLPGTFPSTDYQTSRLVIEKTRNYAFVAGTRSISNANNYINKVDISLNSPVSIYYSYNIQDGVSTNYGVTALALDESTDFFITLQRQAGSQQFLTVVVQTQSRGDKVAHRQFLNKNTLPSSVYQDLLSDGQHVYLGVSEFGTQICIRLIKMKLSNLDVVGSVGYTPLEAGSLLITTLANDTNFVYLHAEEPDSQYRYLHKYRKSDLTIVQTSIFLSFSTQNELKNRMIVYDNMLYLFFTNDGLNQCGSLSTTVENTLTNYVFTGDIVLSSRIQMYYEYWVRPEQIIKSATDMRCNSYGPKFEEELEDQIIILPASKTYTFNWPKDCFASQLNFTWSVDLFTTPPGFISVLNTSSTTSINMNPTASNVGTYVLRLRFEIQGRFKTFTEKTIVVEVYPEQSYGQTDLKCESEIFPVLLRGGNTNPLEWHAADMDQESQHFVLCGISQNATYDKTTSSYSGFISSYTISMNPEFVITVDTLYSTKNCKIYSGYQGYIQSLFVVMSQNTYESDFQDTIALFMHTKQGIFQKARQLTSPQNILDYRDYRIDLDTGHQYISGYHKGTYMRRGIQIHSFICKLDKDYKLIFFTSYNIQGQDIFSLSLAFTSTNIFEVIAYRSNYLYFGLQSIKNTDGDLVWRKGFYNPGNPASVYLGQYALGTIFRSVFSVQEYNGQLYAAFFYQTTLSSTGNKACVGQFDSQTGALVNQVEWDSLLTHAIQLLHQKSNPSKIFVSWGEMDNLRIAQFTIGGTPSLKLEARVLRLQCDQTPDFAFQKLGLIERDSTIWLWTRFRRPSSQLQSHFFMTKTVGISNWDNPCTLSATYGFTFIDNYLNTLGAPTGQTASFIPSNWNDVQSSLIFGVHKLPPSTFYRWFTNIEKMQLYPVSQSAIGNQITIVCPTVYPKATSLPDRIGDQINSTTGGFNVNSIAYSFQVQQFSECANRAITYSVTYGNGGALSNSTLFSFDPISMNLVIRAFSNAQINSNKAPFPKLNFATDVSVPAHHYYKWAVSFDKDSENDIASFSVQLYNANNVSITGASNFVKVELSDDTGIIFYLDDPPQPATGASIQQYYIRVLVSDQFNTLTPNIYNISLKVLKNSAPTIHPSISQVIPQIFITQSFDYTIWYSNFTDAEGDQKVFSCNVQTTAQNSLWISQTINNTQNGYISYYGQTPRNNAFAGTYTFQCSVKDIFDAPANLYNFVMVVSSKPAIIIQTSYSKVSFLLPETREIDFTDCCVDPLIEQIYYSLRVNSTIYDSSQLGSWLYWNNSTLKLKAEPTQNSQGGNHSISLIVEDKINPIITINFTLEIIHNFPLKIIRTIPDRTVPTYTWFYFDFNMTALFINPENKQFQMYFRQAQMGNTLPYFISKNYSNGTLGGFAGDENIGPYVIECVGVDDGQLETVIPFQLTVKPCYYKCQQCWDSDYNTCLSCRQSYFYYNSECISSCPFGYFANQLSSRCQKCPAQCSSCTESNPLQDCQTCSKGYFFYRNGCYQKCPDGLFGDKRDYTCKRCHEFCSLCFGETSRQCYNCTETYGLNPLNQVVKRGYLLIQTTCSNAVCPAGQYFKWNEGLVNGIHTGRCNLCHQDCKTCFGPGQNECLECYLGYRYSQQTYSCTKCEDLDGMFTNEEGQCNDICGDGKIRGSQCDDGNIISGDGCSQTCVVEPGFACEQEGLSCREIINPKFQVVSLSSLNQAFISFSEQVTIEHESAFSQDNLDIFITGPAQTAYKFSWRLIQAEANPLLPNKLITKFSILIEDYQQHMDGSEIISIRFLRSDLIKDLSGNPIVQGYQASVNANPYFFLSPEEKQSAGAGAQASKFSVISVFSFNLLLRLLLKNSMQFLWGLVHSLQVFNYLLFINIEFPPNLLIFTKYFDVASGEVDEVDQYIPNLADYIIDERRVLEQSDNQKIYYKFEENEISPYLLIAYGQSLTIWSFSLLIILPTVLSLNKLCKNVKLWDEIKGSFFYNLPLRGFIEQYLEISLQVIVNVNFIKLKNYDQSVVSLAAFVFGALTLLIPFISMTIIRIRRKGIEKSAWNQQYGTLTEGVRKENITQLFYYPLFMLQRLFIAATIGMAIDYPLLQCLLVIICNCFMIVYIVLVKPFKEENLQVTQVLDECIITICVMLFYYLGSQDSLTMDQRKNIGWLIVLLISFSVVKNLAVVLYFGIHKARESLSEIFEDEDNQLDSVHSSEEEKDFVDDGDEDETYIDTRDIIDEIRYEYENSPFRIVIKEA